jgi:iron complex outermembrane receptor protein
MRQFLTILISIFVSTFLCAQKGSISGIITDAESKEPLISANIKVGKTGTMSGPDGSYRLEVDAGTVVINVSYLGYKTVEQKIVIAENENRTLNISMEVELSLLQTATVTSGKFEKPLGEVTVSLDVIKPSLLENVNTTSVDDVLDKVPGVTIIDGQANIRGGSGFSYGAGSRVLLLVDDIPALQADAGFPNWKDIAVENVEQIEVVKGAASALYGSAAMNGIINVRNGFAKSEPVTHFSTFGTYYLNPADIKKKWWTTPKYGAGASLLHKRKFKKIDLVASGFYINDDQPNEFTFNKYGRITLGTRYRITDRLSVGFNSNFNKGVSSSFFIWKDGADNAYRGDATTIVNSEKQRFFIDPYIHYYQKNGNRHKLLGRVYSVNNQVSGGKSNQSDLFYGEYQFQRQMEAISLITTAGLVYTNTKINAELYGNDVFTSNNAAAYLQLDKKFWDKLNVSAGIRYEQNNITAPDVTVGDTTFLAGTTGEAKPVLRLGLNYQTGKATFIRASWGQGYRFPTIAEKFIRTNAGFEIFPNPALTSETGWSTELGLKQGIRISDWLGYFDFAAFWSEYQDMMEFTFNPMLFGFQSQNVGNTVIKGTEFSIMGQGAIFGLPTNVMTGYTYIDPKFKNFSPTDSMGTSSGTNFLKYRYKHSLKFDLETKIKSFSIGLSVIYNSHMENIDAFFDFFIPGVHTFREEHDNGFTIVDLRTSYTFGKAKASLICGNLLNEEYTVRPALLENPRNITFRLDYKF